VQVPDQVQWMPVEVGRSWRYVYARERSRAVDGGATQVEHVRGTLSEVIVRRSPELGSRTVELHTRLDGQSDGPDAAIIESSRTFLTSKGANARVYALEVSDPLAGRKELVHYEKPLELLRSGVAIGQKWPVGIRRASGVQTEIEGEVLGVQSAQTPAGLYEKCLVVRYTGRIAGVTDAYGSRIEIPSGELVSTEWYAPGVGRVLIKRELSQILILPDGSKVQFVERTQYALQESTGAAPVQPAATVQLE